MNDERAAVILLSGGLDSATALAVAKSEGYRRFALSLRYGQRNQYELEAAGRVAGDIGVDLHLVVDVDLAKFGGSALTSDIPVPKRRPASDIGRGIPVTYVPARNTVFLALALAWAEALGAFDIFIGVNALDYSGYPDCRPEYIEAFERMANLATKAGVEKRGQFRIRTPLLRLSKSEIIRLGTSLGVDYSLTSSCYDPSAQGQPCGECDACRLRREGFRQAGLREPLTRV